MINHIFCDLDGTLLKEFYKIDEEDIKALQLAQEKGISISIATGRLDYEIKMLMEKYHFHGYRISQNGAVVFDDNDNLVYEKCLSYEDVQVILKALNNKPVIIFFQTVDSYYVEKKLPVIIEFEKNQPYIKYNENSNIYNELAAMQLVTISIWAEKDYNIIIKQELDKVLPYHIVSYVSSKYTLDITHMENSKGNAIKHLRLPFNEIAVIGDSQNDISMFNITKKSYVMDDADISVKKHAQFTVKNVKEAILDILNNR